MNFPHYPGTVTEVVAVEPENNLRALAEHAAATAPVPVKVLAGHGDALLFDEASFDAAVVSLVLCSVPEPGHFLAEVQRVLKPGGQLRFFEHVRSSSPLIGVFQDVITPVWGAIGGTGFADWPITYEELEPYYTKVDWEIGVSGAPGPYDAHRSRGYPLPPMPNKSSGVLLERAASKLGLHAQVSPMAKESRMIV